MRTDQLKTLWALAFGDEERFIDLFFSTAYAPERCHFLTEGERVTAALYWLDCRLADQKIAYIYGVATHPAHRGKGLCRTLMAQTHEILAEQGYASAILMPAEPGLRRMYAKMGYRECASISRFSCTAGTAVPLRPVDAEEYACLRRKYLPAGGVIQEGENLRYLQTYAALYTGEDFLLTAVHEEGSLFGMELLGNAAAAPGILAAMGYETGNFRIPGGDIPFAMFSPLQEDAQIPAYLGLAFD